MLKENLANDSTYQKMRHFDNCRVKFAKNQRHFNSRTHSEEAQVKPALSGDNKDWVSSYQVC